MIPPPSTASASALSTPLAFRHSELGRLSPKSRIRWRCRVRRRTWPRSRFGAGCRLRRALNVLSSPTKAGLGRPLQGFRRRLTSTGEAVDPLRGYHAHRGGATARRRRVTPCPSSSSSRNRLATRQIQSSAGRGVIGLVSLVASGKGWSFGDEEAVVPAPLVGTGTDLLPSAPSRGPRAASRVRQVPRHLRIPGSRRSHCGNPRRNRAPGGPSPHVVAARCLATPSRELSRLLGRTPATTPDRPGARR